MKTITQLPFLAELDSERQKVFNKLKVFAPDFTLAGGTGIMLQIGHRYSVDFDLFSEKEFGSGLLRKIKNIFSKTITVEINTPEIISIVTSKDITVTFVYHPYPPLKKPIKTISVNLYHMDDLAANKAYTIGRRGKWRDYIDLFFLLKWQLYTIADIIRLAEKKFIGEFNDKLFLEQLTYFSDLEIVPVDFIRKKYTPAEVKFLLEKETHQYLKKVL